MTEEKGPIPRDVTTETDEEKAANELDPSSRPYRVTVEVPCFIIFYCTAVTAIVMVNVLINRACVHQLGHTDEHCQLLQMPGQRPPEIQDLESEVQSFVTIVNMVKAVMDGIIPALLALFLGAWSNKYGRKPLIVGPSMGFAVSTCLLLIYSYVETLGPWWFLVTSLPYAFVGAGPAFITGSFCLLNDISSVKNRTLRLVCMQSAIYVGIICGSLSSSYLQRYIGTNNLLIMALCLSVVGSLYSVFFISETVTKTESGTGIRSVLDIALVKDMVRTCFKRRVGYGRLVIMLIIAANTIDLFISYGIGPIEYLFVRQRLSWDLSEYTLFNAVNTVVLVFGLFLGVAFLQRLCKISDQVTALISYVSCALEAIVRALAYVSWIMYFGSIISIFRGISIPLNRAMISKRVSGQDVAKIFALISVIDAISPLVAPLFYNTVYRATLDTLLGTVYYVNVGLYVICFLLMWVAWRVMVRHPLEEGPKEGKPIL